MTYPFKKPPTIDPAEEEAEGGADATAWPLQLTYTTVPNSFVRKEAATVKWWNEETKGWDDEGISGVEIDGGEFVFWCL